jgi:hypothetical protein
LLQRRKREKEKEKEKEKKKEREKKQRRQCGEHRSCAAKHHKCCKQYSNKTITVQLRATSQRQQLQKKPLNKVGQDYKEKCAKAMH